MPNRWAAEADSSRCQQRAGGACQHYDFSFRTMRRRQKKSSGSKVLVKNVDYRKEGFLRAMIPWDAVGEDPHGRPAL